MHLLVLLTETSIGLVCELIVLNLAKIQIVLNLNWLKRFELWPKKLYILFSPLKSKMQIYCWLLSEDFTNTMKSYVFKTLRILCVSWNIHYQLFLQMNSLWNSWTLLQRTEVLMNLNWKKNYLKHLGKNRSSMASETQFYNKWWIFLRLGIWLCKVCNCCRFSYQTF